MENKGEKFKVKIHFSFVILIVLAGLMGALKLMILYFLCLVIHEVIHGLVALKFGYEIGKINLAIGGAILESESDEFSFKDEIFIALSAPLFNLFLSIFLLGVWWVCPEIYNYSQDLFVINLSIFMFNILPVFPLDGGRVLLAFLSLKFKRKVAVLITKIVSIFIAVFVFILFLFSLFRKPNFYLGVVAITLFLGAVAKDKQAVYKRILYVERKRKRTMKNGVEVRYLMFNENVDISHLLKFIDVRFFTIFLIVNNNYEIKKRIFENELLKK